MKKIAYLFTLLFLLNYSPVFATTTTPKENLKANVAQGLNTSLPRLIDFIKRQDGTPAWIRRTDVSINFQKDLKPLWTLETVQPLYQSELLTHTVFFQGRFAYDADAIKDDKTMNLGLGYRYLTASEKWLLGVNTFYDQTIELRHERLSLGGEIIGQYISMHLNYYEGISGRRDYIDMGITMREKALSGWDIEGQIQFPYMPWMYTTFRGYNWEGELASDLTGYQYSLLMDVSKHLRVEVGKTKDSNGEDTFAKFTFRTNAPHCVQYTMLNNFVETEFFTKRDLKNQTLAKVRRNNAIVVEKTRGGSGLSGIYIGRGN